MTTLKLWSKGSEVKTLQSKLNLIEDGIFGPITEEAVKDFQKEFIGDLHLAVRFGEVK